MNMKTLLPLLAATILSGSAFAAETTGDAGAKIVAPLQVASVSALYFGTIAPSLTDAGSVQVSPAGDKECSVEVTCLTDDHTAAEFKVTGEADFSYTIELPKEIKIANANGTSMLIGEVAGSKDAGTLVNGADNFTVGGTLAVAALQEAGSYKGTFTVAVEYQ